MRVKYFQRKPRSGTNYSLENVFEGVRNQLCGVVESSVWIAPFESSGFLKRLLSCISAWWARDQVNHVTGDVNFLAILLPKRRTVLTVLDLGILNRTYGIRRFLVWLFWFQLPVFRSQYVTVISDATRKSLLEAVWCKPEKVVVIPVAISDAFKKAEKQFDSACPIILQVGTAPNKNLGRVVRAIGGVSCEFWIIGPLTDDDIVLLESHKVNYRNWVNLSESEVIERYKDCDMVMFASTFEGFGMPILEANAIGRPVITSNLTSMPEVAGEAALLVDPYDVSAISNAVRMLSADKKLREDLVSCGFQNVKRFHPQQIAELYVAIYKRISE